MNRRADAGLAGPQAVRRLRQRRDPCRCGPKWNVSSTPNTSDQGGGQVRITSYSVARSESEPTGWEWSRPANVPGQLFRDVTITVTRTGRTGGGGVEGPVLRPAGKSR